MSSRPLRSRLAWCWVAATLAAGATSGGSEVVHALVSHEVDGRGLIARWQHACDPPEDRIQRAFGNTYAPIEAALRPDPPQSCWVRLRTSSLDAGVALRDAQLARSLHHRFFPTQYEPLPIDEIPTPDSGRWVLDLEFTKPLDLAPGFERVAGTRRFALWRPARAAR